MGAPTPLLVGTTDRGAPPQPRRIELSVRSAGQHSRAYGPSGPFTVTATATATATVMRSERDPGRGVGRNSGRRGHRWALDACRTERRLQRQLITQTSSRDLKCTRGQVQQLSHSLSLSCTPPHVKQREQPGF